MSIIPSAAPNDTSPGAPTPDRVNDIRTRELLATRGPWGLYDSEDGFVDIAADLKENGTGYNCRRSIAQLEADLIDNDPAHADWSEGEEREQVLADAEFIAHAREDVPALLAEVDRLRARIAELEALKPARFQDCQVCGAGYEYGQPCPSCEFKARMATETAPRDLRPGAEAARRTIRDRQTADSAPLARRLRRISPMEELARDLESVIAPLKGDARRGAELALTVIRTRAAAATIPTTEDAS